MNTALLRKVLGNTGPELRALTLSGNEITDATRALGIQGDGLLNDSSYGIWPAATNLCTNGGFETDTTGWTAGGTNTIASSATQFKFGAKSNLATYSNNATLADYAATIANVAHTVSVWLYIPAAYDGAGIELRQLNYTVAASATNASMATRDAWQKATLTFTPGADVIGNIQVNNTGAAPTAGRFIYIDGFQIETGSIATPYIETDGGTASRSAGRVRAPASLLNVTKGAVLLRWRSPRVTPQTAAFGRVLEWGTYQAQALYLGLSGSGAGNVPLMFTRHTTTSTGHSTIPNVGAELAAGAVYTIGAQWDEAGYNIVFNGVKYGVTADTLIPVLTDTTIDIGGDGGGICAGGDYLWAAFYDDKSTTLSAGDVATIHAFGNSDRGLDAFPGNPSGYWSAANGFMEVRA